MSKRTEKMERGDVYALISRIDVVLKEVDFIGYGEFKRHVVPPRGIHPYFYGITSAWFVLEDGTHVFGCECWYELAEEFKFKLKYAEMRGYSLKMVSIKDLRKLTRES